MSETWLLWQSSSCAPADNMAWDEALLLSAARLEVPVLRFYGWPEPAATFGYFQRYAEVETWTKLRPLIRRTTGGGLVPHDADWTYTLAFPPMHPWYALKAVQSYERVHAWIQSAFAQANVATELSPAPRQEAPGQCFIGAEQFDVLWQDRKIAGGAQRRNRSGLLIQGSIQPPPGLSRSEWEKSFCEVAQRQWGVEWQPFELNAGLVEKVRVAWQQKYSRPEYNQRR